MLSICVYFCHEWNIPLENCVSLCLGVFTPWQREKGAFRETLDVGSSASFSLCWQLRRAGCWPAALCLWAWTAGLPPDSLWNVFSLGPSMVVRIALVLILSTSFVIQKNAKSTSRTSGPSSANSVIPTLNTRIPNTTGCRMNILTVSRYHSFSCCVDGHLALKLCWHQALALLSPVWQHTKRGTYRSKSFRIPKSQAKECLSLERWGLWQMWYLANGPVTTAMGNDSESPHSTEILN